MRKGVIYFIIMAAIIFAIIQWFKENLGIVIVVGALILLLVIWLIERNRRTTEIVRGDLKDLDRVLDINCSRLGLPTKVYNILRYNGIYTIRDLTEAYNSRRLFTLYGIGEKSISEIYEALWRVSAFDALDRERGVFYAADDEDDDDE